MDCAKSLTARVNDAVKHPVIVPSQASLFVPSGFLMRTLGLLVGDLVWVNRALVLVAVVEYHWGKDIR